MDKSIVSRLAGIVTSADNEETRVSNIAPDAVFTISSGAPKPAIEGGKIYRSRVPGSRMQMPSGDIFFIGGWYETSDPEEIAILDKVANRSPLIYTDEAQDKIHLAITAARSSLAAQGITVTSATTAGMPGAMEIKPPASYIPEEISLQAAMLDVKGDPILQLQNAIINSNGAD